MSDLVPPTPSSDAQTGGSAARRSWRSRLLPWLGTLAVVGLTAAVVLYGASRPPKAVTLPPKNLANVEIRTIHARPYREALVLPARLEADQVAAVSPEFPGKLAVWYVAEGAWVEAGEPLAELDTAALEAQLAELTARLESARLGRSRARVVLEGSDVNLKNARKSLELQGLSVRSAEADLELSQTEFDRVQSLVDKQVMDQAQLDTAKNALTQARIQVDRARQDLERAELGVRSAEVAVAEAEAGLAVSTSAIGELAASIDTLQVQIRKTSLVAPISGRLEEHLSEAGEVVSAGVPVAQLYDLRHLRAVIDVPDRYVAFLDVDNETADDYVRLKRPGAVREIRAALLVPGLPKLTGGSDDALEIPAEIVRIAQAADRDSNTFAVELRFRNPGEALKHGVIARARVEYLTYPAAIVIPSGAIRVTDAGPRVMVAERQEDAWVAVSRDVVPASIRDDEILVLEGLEGGDRLIVAGWKGVVSGEEVNVIVADGELVGSAVDAGP